MSLCRLSLPCVEHAFRRADPRSPSICHPERSGRLLSGRLSRPGGRAVEGSAVPSERRYRARAAGPSTRPASLGRDDNRREALKLDKIKPCLPLRKPPNQLVLCSSCLPLQLLWRKAIHRASKSRSLLVERSELQPVHHSIRFRVEWGHTGFTKELSVLKGRATKLKKRKFARG